MIFLSLLFCRVVFSYMSDWKDVCREFILKLNDMKESSEVCTLDRIRPAELFFKMNLIFKKFGETLKIQIFCHKDTNKSHF